MPLLLMAKSSPPCASSSPNVASRSGTKKKQSRQTHQLETR